MSSYSECCDRDKYWGYRDHRNCGECGDICDKGYRGCKDKCCRKSKKPALVVCGCNITYADCVSPDTPILLSAYCYPGCLKLGPCGNILSGCGDICATNSAIIGGTGQKLNKDNTLLVGNFINDGSFKADVRSLVYNNSGSSQVTYSATQTDYYIIVDNGSGNNSNSILLPPGDTGRVIKITVIGTINIQGSGSQVQDPTNNTSFSSSVSVSDVTLEYTFANNKWYVTSK